MSQEADGPKTSDTYAKTLALLRRLLVGNSYGLEDIKLDTVEEKDLHLPGRIVLELQVIPTETRVPGLPKGNEAAVVNSRDELFGFISNHHAELAENSAWVDEIRARLAKSPAGGWGLKQGDWELGKQTKRVALVVPCDICRGQKSENCRLCFGHREINCPHCNGAREVWCQTCQGSGANPQDRNQPCPHCYGKMKLPCAQCQARGRIVCHQCRGTGRTSCIECQGHGFFTEETLLKASAQGRFQIGSLSATPKGVMSALDAIGVDNIVRGHAVVTPVPAHEGGGTYIEYDALLPYGRYTLHLNKEAHEVAAVGMKPVLADFPPLLDDVLGHVPEQLNAGTLVAMSRKYRLIRELAEALGRGEKPSRFFSQRYPYGLTAPLAFAITDKLRKAFASVSLLPRVLTGLAAVLLCVGGYYGWLVAQRPTLPVPAAAVDGALALVLAVLGWVAVGLVGKWAIGRALPMRTTLMGAGAQTALVTAIAILLGCAVLLYLPGTRPEWVGLYLK